ncbi:MAG TPA: hypothetical protein VNB94_00900 [Mycobacteriales bacterium]|nr:hypothetical protein [Mycobacteriales bacterium]
MGTVVTALAWVAGNRAVEGRARWKRSNFRGATVTLAGGLAGIIVLVLGSAEKLVAAGRWIDDSLTVGVRRCAVAMVVATAAAGLVGLYDDLYGDPGAKGFRGHLAALARGRLTSGVGKIAVICGAAIVSAIALAGGAFGLQQLVDAGVIAGGANLANLLDLRPGRALKVLLLVAVPLLFAVGPAVGLVLAWPAGVAVALLVPDLREVSMLGDGGANAMGAAVGVGVAAAGGLITSSAALAGLVAVTAISEVTSFSSLIERCPPLRWADGLGRRL